MTDFFTHRIEVYTNSLVIAGSYDLSIYRRVSDAVNGEQRRFLQLRDATLAPFERPQQLQRVPSLLVDRSGSPRGRVMAVLNHGAGDVIEIEAEGRTLLLPFTRQAVPEIDLAARRLVIDPPVEHVWEAA